MNMILMKNSIQSDKNQFRKQKKRSFITNSSQLTLQKSSEIIPINREDGEYSLKRSKSTISKVIIFICKYNNYF